MPELKNRNQKIGCKIPNNRISLTDSRKTHELKKKQKLKSVEDLLILTIATEINRFLSGCEFHPFYKQIDYLKKKCCLNRKHQHGYFFGSGIPLVISDSKMP